MVSGVFILELGGHYKPVYGFDIGIAQLHGLQCHHLLQAVVE